MSTKPPQSFGSEFQIKQAIKVINPRPDRKGDCRLAVMMAINRIHRDVLQRPYETSSGDVRVVALDAYLSSLLEHLQRSLRSEGHGASLNYEFDPLKLKTDASINLGVVMTEWVTNACKYAYPEQPGEVRVRLRQLPQGRAELSVADDGVGRKDGPIQGTGLGTRIVNAMAASMGADIDYLDRQPGTIARLTFPLQIE